MQAPFHRSRPDAGPSGGGYRKQHRKNPLCALAVEPVVEQLERRRLLSAVHSHAVVHPRPLPHINVPSPLKAHPDFQSSAKPNAGGSTVPYGLTPGQMRSAYGVEDIEFGNIVGDGAGQTIAIVDAYDYPTALSDLNAFSSYFGLPTFNAGTGSPTFTKYNQNGSTSNLPGDDTSDPAGDDWETEESLDIEWAHSIAPDANIDLVEGNSDTDTDLFTADATAATLPGVSVVSNSWSESEFLGENSQDANFNVTGVTYLYSSGDGGSGAGTQYPAASPDVRILMSSRPLKQ